MSAEPKKNVCFDNDDQRACESSASDDSSIVIQCECPRDEHDLVKHQETCLMFKREEIILPPREIVCGECHCTPRDCRCVFMSGREALDEWRKNRPMGVMPAVLEATHPLMQKFQEALKQFLIKENKLAEEQLLDLRDELREKKQAYEKDLETIYIRDHDTNTQRAMILEYEQALAQRATERAAAEKRVQEANERYKKAKEKLDQDIVKEREVSQELEALSSLCRQLETWRDETESDLTVTQRMSDKMKAERQAIAAEKRQLDLLLFGLNNEVWKLESKLEMFQKQIEIKNVEMEKVNDKVTAYAAELEDLELDKRRLISLWNSVIGNIKQRDKVYDYVRDDYKSLQDNYRTLLNNLEITKKVMMEEMTKGRELSMNKDGLTLELENALKLQTSEEAKKIALEEQIDQLGESIEMTDRDREMIKAENNALTNALSAVDKELVRKTNQKKKIENEILINMQECLLNDKAVESMANGIRKMRELSKKQELTLMEMENAHAKVMLDIEVYRNRQANNNRLIEESLAKVKAREAEIDALQAEYEEKALFTTRKQRELDVVMKKYNALKEIFNMQSPQERRIDELERQVKALREKTEVMQHEWLRLQGHVVKLTEQHHKMVSDINLVNKQIQICEQKIMSNRAECESVVAERGVVERSLRALRGRLEVLERTRKESLEKNEHAYRFNVALTTELTASLKDAEAEIIQLEEEIENLDREKFNLTQELDKVQKEALIWQRKGILAVELKKNIATSKSSSGEIGQMKSEIHKMEVRREQLRRTSEKLADDLALYVTRRDTALEKSRATAAVERSYGSSTTSQFTYHHKLRLAKVDVTRVTKEIAEAKERIKTLREEQQRLGKEVNETSALNSQLEENVADMIRECYETNKMKQWLLERVVRSQRLGQELSTAIKRQSLKGRKPTNTVLAEFDQAKALNDRLRYIVEVLERDFPHLADKLAFISNTLNIYSPSNSPRLTEEIGCCLPNCSAFKEVPEEVPVDENVAEKEFVCVPDK